MSETQIDRLLCALRGAGWLSLLDLHSMTSDPIASISANLRNLRKPEHGSHTINRRRRAGSFNLFEYHLGDTEPGERESGE
jgi:hypothetical protein